MSRRTRLNPNATLAEIIASGPQVDVPVALGATVSRYNINHITQAGTSRLPYHVPVACTNLRLVYHNWLIAYPNNGTGELTAADLPIKVGIEYNSVIYRVTFGGATNPTINAFGYIISDPIGLDIPANSTIYVRTYTSSTDYYSDRVAYLGGGGGFVATTDLTAPLSSAVADSVSSMIGPCAILGTPSSRIATVLGVGDSIMNGFVDGIAPTMYNETYSNDGRGGFLARAARNTGFGFLNIAINGEIALQWNTTGYRPRRMAFGRFCKTVVCDYGINDLAASESLATIQGYLITLWSNLTNQSYRVFQTNMVPQTTSTDGYVTLGNQTVRSWESVRVALNAWLRDGAPMSGGAAVAVGTAGASRCRYFNGNTIVTPASGPAHPLYGLIEIADTCESARDSGKWKLPYYSRTVNDATTTASSTTVGSASAAFTTADIGREVLIAGAGAAGVLFTGNINSVALTSTSVKVYNVAPATTVSGASMTIQDPTTRDGVHPQPLLHEELAGKMPTNYFI